MSYYLIYRKLAEALKLIVIIIDYTPQLGFEIMVQPKKNIVNTPLYYILIMVCCMLWGSSFAGAKIGFQYCSPIMLAGLRFSLAGVILLPVLLMGKKTLLSLFKHWKYMLFFGFIQTFLQAGLFFVGLNDVPGAVASIVGGLGPILVTLLAHFTIKGDTFSLRKILSCIIGFSGILFIALNKDGLNTMSNEFYYGVVLLVISNVLGATTNIIVKKQQHLNVSPVALTSFSNLSGGIMLLIGALIFEPITLDNPPLEFYLSLLWLAIIPAAGFSIWYYLLAQESVKVSELNIWKFTVPIIGSVLSWLLLKNEEPTWPEIIGILIISIAIIVLEYPTKNKIKIKKT